MCIHSHRGHFRILASVLAVACLANSVWGDELFRRLDRDGDGQLVPSEVDSSRRFLVQRLLRTADANHDGFLSAAEFAAGTRKTRADLQDVPAPPTSDRVAAIRKNRQRMQAAAKAFERMDKNHDGRLELSEVPENRRATARRALQRLGTDSLTRQQFGRLMQKQMRERGPSPNRRPSDKVKDQAGQRGADRQRPSMERLMQLDRDRDGRLSKDEVTDRLQRFFPRLDKNADGFLDKRELKPAIDHMQKRPRPAD